MIGVYVMCAFVNLRIMSLLLTSPPCVNAVKRPALNHSFFSAQFLNRCRGNRERLFRSWANINGCFPVNYFSYSSRSWTPHRSFTWAQGAADLQYYTNTNDCGGLCIVNAKCKPPTPPFTSTRISCFDTHIETSLKYMHCPKKLCNSYKPS